MVARRGEIWWVTLPAPEASEPGFSRPVLVVSADDFNASRIGTVVAVAITSNTQLAAAPGNVLLSRRASGLLKKSVANVSQLITIDKSFLVEKVKRVTGTVLADIEDGMKLVLALD